MEECYICYNIMKNKVVLSCKHELCNFCYNHLINPLCPFCRTEIEDNSKEQKYEDNYDEFNIGIVGRQQRRKRRKNLSYDEIIEKRRIIREKCRRKWMIKENRLSKINWFDIII